MKRIIDGMKYDTEQSDLIYETCINTEIRVYNTKRGNFFSVVNVTGDGENSSRIIPMTLDEVKNLIERRANDRYEEILGEIEG